MEFPDLNLLNRRFGVSGHVAFREGPGGLPVVTVTNTRGAMELSLYGGQVLSYCPAGQSPALFVSRSSLYTPGKPIRGGIPVCWPWFGPRADEPTLPMHGFARLLCWTMEAVKDGVDGTEVRLGLRDDARTRELWPHAFELSLSVVLGASLRVELTTRNTGSQPFVLTQALHTYFVVGDIGRVSITGLEATPFLDTLTRTTVAAEGAPITIRSEVDRIYSDTTSDCLIRDAALGRQVRVAKGGSRSTVVWNPWIEKSKRMPDFGDDEYVGMLCIEATNAADDVITVMPGLTHTLSQTLSVTPRA